VKIESNEVAKFSCEVDGGSREVDRGRSFIKNFKNPRRNVSKHISKLISEWPTSIQK
jgi:hypothetical protein